MNPEKRKEGKGNKMKGDFKSSSLKLKAWERRRVKQLKVKRTPKPDMR